jgi:hypothetical protein
MYPLTRKTSELLLSGMDVEHGVALDTKRTARQAVAEDPGRAATEVLPLASSVARLTVEVVAAGERFQQMLRNSVAITGASANGPAITLTNVERGPQLAGTSEPLSVRGGG